MSLPFPTSRLQLPAEKPAIVQVVSREDVIWNRPIFRAPPLKVQPLVLDPTAFLFPSLATPTAAR